MAKRSQQDSGEERVTAKSRPMMNLIARTPSFVSSSTSVCPVKRSYESQDPWSSLATKEERLGRPDKSTDLFEASDHHYREQFMESFSSISYSKLDYDRAWSSQEWKSGAAEHDRSGKPEEISWDILQKVDPHRAEPLLGRNAHSARYGELIHDRTGKPVSVHHQEQAYSENFVMGSDAAEFVDKVKDQVRNRQKRMSNVAESGDEHSIIW